MRYMKFIMKCKAKEPSEISGASLKKRKKLKASLGISGWETHHIAPRSRGGSNRGNNLVTLTALNHCVAHLIYAQENKDIDSGASTACWRRSLRFVTSKKDLENAVVYVATNATISTKYHQGFTKVYRKYVSQYC